MSPFSSASDQTLRQALCLDCGAVRTARARYIGRGSRTLRCEPCRRGTQHAAVNWDGVDPREEANRRQAQGAIDATRELDSQLRLFRSCSIDVVVISAVVGGETDPRGGLVDVIRWREPESYQVRVNGSLSPVDQISCLDWAWQSLRPSVARWHRCPIEIDVDGELFQRIHNNAKQLGLFPSP